DEPASETWPFARHRPPASHMWTIRRPQVEEPEILKSCRKRHEIDVGKRQLTSDDPRTGSRQRFLQQLECPFICRHGKQNVGRARTQLVGRFHAIAPALIADIPKTLLAKLFGHLSHAFTKHRRKAELADALKQTFIDHLAPNPHSAAPQWVGRN